MRDEREAERQKVRQAELAKVAAEREARAAEKAALEAEEAARQAAEVERKRLGQAPGVGRAAQRGRAEGRPRRPLRSPQGAQEVAKDFRSATRAG